MTTPEKVEIINEQGEIVEVVTREQAEQNDGRTKNVLVFIFNNTGLVWTQLRPDHKRLGGLWDISACGSVKAEETPEQAALRELGEELGIQTDLTQVDEFINRFTDKLGRQREFLSFVYLGLSDAPPQLDPEEVAAVSLDNPTVRLQQSIEHPELFVPSFSSELARGIAAFKRKF